jgi:hypothetical protein
MYKVLQSVGVVICGMTTSVLTALIVASLAAATGVNIFTFALWIIVPVGAIVTGFAASSGYFFGSYYLNKRANRLLLVEMVVVAGLTQGLIYYLDYRFSVLHDGRHVADVVPFGRYLAVILTSAHYRVSHAMFDVGEVGAFGYVLAVVQFFGFLIGGLSTFLVLISKPMCTPCEKYMRNLAGRKKIYPSSALASPYYNELFKHPFDSSEFAALIRQKAVAAARKGAFAIGTRLFRCPECGTQLITENVQVHDGSKWHRAPKLSRQVVVPAKFDLHGVFNAV